MYAQHKFLRQFPVLHLAQHTHTNSTHTFTWMKPFTHLWVNIRLQPRFGLHVHSHTHTHRTITITIKFTNNHTFIHIISTRRNEIILKTEVNCLLTVKWIPNIPSIDGSRLTLIWSSLTTDFRPDYSHWNPNERNEYVHLLCIIHWYELNAMLINNFGFWILLPTIQFTFIDIYIFKNNWTID